MAQTDRPSTMILKLVATVVILALVLYSLDLEKLSGALSAIDWHWLVLGSLASALFVSLRIIKWRELTRTERYERERQGDRENAALLGLAVGSITPVRLGELVGVAPFPRPDRGKAILSHGYDRLYELFAVLVFSLPAAFLLPWRDRPPGQRRHRRGCTGLALSWRSLHIGGQKFGGLSLLRQSAEAPSSAQRHHRALSRSIGCCRITYFLTGYLLLMCFIVGIEPIHNWHAVFYSARW